MTESSEGLASSTNKNLVISDREVSIGMVAGEASGDILGAGLIKALRKRYPNARFEGIGGPLMIKEGFRSHVPMERLSVMGLVEVLGRLFELIGIRRKIKKYFKRKRPDVFIGIDAPDFNIGLELALRKAGIKTGHYVSPSVWAWRQKRVFKIARAVDLMLALFPFEAKFYKDHSVSVRFVGHPLADQIPDSADKVSARQELDMQVEGGEKVVALLPGSRSGELAYIGKSMIETASWLYERDSTIRFVLPYVNDERYEQIRQIINEVPHAPPIMLVKGRSRTVMAASDVIVLASGTATLEAMLLKRPMVVVYKVSKITHFIMKRLLKAPFISLPNLLANKALVPELLQDQASAPLIGQSVIDRLDSSTSKQTELEFSELHNSIRLDASEEAAKAVCDLIEGRMKPNVD